ncbi:glycosyltransferase family 2 protein [Candidatus Microgenomates bacterium]|nr:glycosyltransferase family 2 protein [Candidatus Microgenomates bacterium]
MDLSIIILNYNAKDFIIKCLQSIKRSVAGKYSWEIIVSDNASTDGSIEELKVQSEKFKIIENKNNLGFAKGNNVAIPGAKGRYILFLNPDTEVEKNTFVSMIKFMDENSEVGAATCQVNAPGGGLDDGAHRGFPTPWNAFCHFFGLENLFPKSRLFSGYTLGYMSRHNIHEIDALTGAFMIVRREAGEQVGWWDEDYFWYGEDLDFCYRLKKSNWKIMYVPTVSILHYRGISSGVKKQTKSVSSATRGTRGRAALASVEAMRIFYKKHYVGQYPAPILWLVWTGIWILEKYRLLFW